MSTFYLLKDIHVKQFKPTPAPKRSLPPPSHEPIEVSPEKNTFVGNSTGKTYHQLTKEGKSADGKTVKVTHKSGKWSTTADFASLLDPSVSMSTTNDDPSVSMFQQTMIRSLLKTIFF